MIGWLDNAARTAAEIPLRRLWVEDLLDPEAEAVDREADKMEEGKMKLWVCRCGHEVLSVARPEPIKWTDGHKCHFVLVERRTP